MHFGNADYWETRSEDHMASCIPCTTRNSPPQNARLPSTTLGVNFYAYILTPKMGDRIGVCKCAAHCARSQ